MATELEDGGEVDPAEAAAAEDVSPPAVAEVDSSPPAKVEESAAAAAVPEAEPVKEAKENDGSSQETESSSLPEGLSLNYEEARALLGRLEFQKGNVEAALCVFDGIDLQAAIQRFQPSLSEKTPSKKGQPKSESPSSGPQHAASLVLEAIYLKSLSLQKLGKSTEAAQQCKSVLDSVESMFQNGSPDIEQKLQETVNKSVELLPEAWKQAGSYQEALASYRRALLSQWNLDEECCTRIQKRFAVFLLYGSVEGSPPSLASQVEGCFVPKNNVEEAILLLMILLRKWYQGKTHWDPSVMEHLTYALSLCGQPSVLAKHLEEVLPGIYPRTERWYTLALCYYAAGEKEAALNFLRKSLNKHENPNDIMALLLAAKICSEECHLASEGVEYARRAVANAELSDAHLKSVSLHFLGSCLGKKSKIVSSDHQRSLLQTETLKSLTESSALDRHNPDLIFDMGVEYAEQQNMNAALRCAKEYIDATGGSVSKGWRLLALVLSAQQRYAEAEVATDAALDETAKWDQGSLLRIKAKLKVAQSSPMEAVEAYRVLLALVQAKKNSSGSCKNDAEGEDDSVSEFEIWQGLANLYSSLSHWRDAEICLQKARALKSYSAATLQAEGYMHEARQQTKDALAAYVNAFSTELEHVPSKVAIGALLSKQGPKYLPAARCFLSDALRIEPTNRMAWLYLGRVHKYDGRMADAADCFQAAVMLEESDPVESFRYLVIIDDIWHWEECEIIRKSLPKNNLGSRIIMTTRINAIAEKCRTDSDAIVCEIKGLAAYAAAALSERIISGSRKGRAKFIPFARENPCDGIARICGGIPSAVICMSLAVAEQLQPWSEGDANQQDSTGNWETAASGDSGRNRHKGQRATVGSWSDSKIDACACWWQCSPARLSLPEAVSKVRELPWEAATCVSLPEGVCQDLVTMIPTPLLAECREVLSIVVFDRFGRGTVPPHVGVFKVRGRHMQIPSLIVLSSLDIRLCKLEEDDLKFLREMPNLQTLVIRFEVLPRGPVTISGEGFARLESFCVDSRVPRVAFDQGAMPNLKHLAFKFYAGPASEDAAVGITHLRGLEKVVLRCSPWYKSDSPGISATVAAVRREAGKHPNRITLCINGKEEIFPEKESAQISEENRGAGSSGTSGIEAEADVLSADRNSLAGNDKKKEIFHNSYAIASCNRTREIFHKRSSSC